MSKHPHYIIGASLGAGIQPTAVAVLEQEVLKGDKWQAETGAVKLRHLERLSLSVSYPDTVARISKLLDAPEIKDEEDCGEPDVVLDVTGSGRAILDLFNRAELDPVVVTIVGAGVIEGDSVSNDCRVPKIDLVGTLRVLYESERLKMAKDLELVPTLLDELRNFKMRPPRIDLNDPESWREGQFDDLVFAVALGAWQAKRHVPTPQKIHDHWNEMLEEDAERWNRYVV